jgi:hypothetical protein
VRSISGEGVITHTKCAYKSAPSKPPWLRSSVNCHCSKFVSGGAFKLTFPGQSATLVGQDPPHIADPGRHEISFLCDGLLRAYVTASTPAACNFAEADGIENVSAKGAATRPPVRRVLADHLIRSLMSQRVTGSALFSCCCASLKIATAQLSSCEHICTAAAMSSGAASLAALAKVRH